MYKEIILDTRELEAPEPMEKVMDTLPSLDKTNYIKMIHRIEPRMLYDHLEQNDFKYKTVQNEDGFYIYICKNSFADISFFEGL
ncbi:MAG: DUF2249 domain-containing protein [Campylobacterota bacterium]|nr:DUF2249 domain-containing protein [Campylobacterota bacterium]